MCEAPVLIVICSDREHLQSFYEENKNTYSIQNCSVAAQNLMLRAHSLKLGTCFISGFSKMNMRRVLNIPAGSEPEIIISLGFPAEKPKSKRTPIETQVYFEEYGNKRTDKSMWPLGNKIKNLKELFSKIKKK
jgi:nitroreductase